MESTIPSSYRKCFMSMLYFFCVFPPRTKLETILVTSLSLFPHFGSWLFKSSWWVLGCQSDRTRPCGALMMLLYGLTPSPSAQPRNAIVGQAMSMTIGMSVSYMTFIPLWLRQSLGTSLAIAAMVKRGILHAPAGTYHKDTAIWKIDCHGILKLLPPRITFLIPTKTAATAMIFSDGEGDMAWGWSNVGFMLLANILSIGFATCINNLSSQRQYPNYWGIRGPIDFARSHTDRMLLDVVSCRQGGKLKRKEKDATASMTGPRHGNQNLIH